jgi:hypothetical protein
MSSHIRRNQRLVCAVQVYTETTQEVLPRILLRQSGCQVLVRVNIHRCTSLTKLIYVTRLGLQKVTSGSRLVDKLNLPRGQVLTRMSCAQNILHGGWEEILEYIILRPLLFLLRHGRDIHLGLEIEIEHTGLLLKFAAIRRKGLDKVIIELIETHVLSTKNTRDEGCEVCGSDGSSMLRFSNMELVGGQEVLFLRIYLLGLVKQRLQRRIGLSKFRVGLRDDLDRIRVRTLRQSAEDLSRLSRR